MGFQGGLAGGVGVGPEHAGRVGGDTAGDVDDAAPPALEHAGQGHEAEPGGCGEVDGYRGCPLLRVDGRAGSQRPDDRGVVDQHLDRAPPLPDRGERGGDLVRVGDVGGQGERTGRRAR